MTSNDPVLTQAKDLWDRGYSVHWLHPKQKRPIENGWSKGPRRTWAALTGSYRAGMNVGIRLGEASKIDGAGYVAVIDCDCKSTDPRHLAEMEAAVKACFPGLDLERTPVVLTGRGGGSRHYYVGTKTPVGKVTKAKSSEKVEVVVAGGKVEKKTAWEVEILGEGQQVVAPTSTHPDTGDVYRWKNGGLGKPLLQMPAELTGGGGHPTPTSGGSDASASRFTPLTVDLVGSPLSEEIFDLIVRGTGSPHSGGDRSADAYRVAKAMVQGGYSDDEITSVLVDPAYGVSAAALSETRGAGNVEAAARWARKYRVLKAREEVSPAVEDFADSATTTAGEDWKARLGRTGRGAVIESLQNVECILTGHFGPMFRHDLFAHDDVQGVDVPWAKKGARIVDAHKSELRLWFAHQWGFEPADKILEDAINVIGRRHAFHPVREYLDGLVWDGTPRLATWLETYMGAKGPEGYIQAVSTKVLTAMVARAYRPGVKFDYVVTLEGDQGIGKSWVLKNLVGDKWYSDAPLNVNDKDSVLAMSGAWLRELGELSGLRKADVNQLKEFISRTTDRIRVPYGKRFEEFPRECVYITTVNPEEGGYLRDRTGNRRFWPVRTTTARFQEIERDRDQLFAEARVAWEGGEPLYLEDGAVNRLAVDEQYQRLEVDVLVEEIMQALDVQTKSEKPEFDPNCFMSTELLVKLDLKKTPQDQKRFYSALMQLGFTLKSVRLSKYNIRKRWVRKD